jgi:hypothetical protein
MLGRRTRHEDRRNRGPSFVRPLARLAFMLLVAGFTTTAAGMDPAALAAGAGRWIVRSTLGAVLKIEAP